MTAKNKRTRERILECARELFYEKGLQDTTQQEIADLAGLNRGLIHHYFGSKEGIATLIFEQFIGEFYPMLNQRCFQDEEDMILTSIARGRVLFQFLLGNPMYRRFFSQLIQGGLATEVVENSVLRDFRCECEYLGLGCTEEQMRLYSVVLASVECRLMSARFDGAPGASNEEILDLYNRIHLNLLGMTADEQERTIQRAITACNRITFVEGAPFAVTPQQFEQVP